MGYLDEISRIRKKDMLHFISRKAVENEKNIYSLSAFPTEAYGDIIDVANKNKCFIHYPSVSDDIYSKILLNSDLLRIKINTPQLAIFGTSSQQGKFTTQMTLVDELKKKDFNVGTICTEHQGELFCPDFTFPMGYDKNIKMTLEKYPFIIRAVTAEMEKCDYDINIFSSQSGIIPYEIKTFAQVFTLPSIALLFGFNADAFILCVNYNDEDEFIQMSIKALEILGKSKVIMLVFSDHEKKVKSSLGYSRIIYNKLNSQDIQNKISYLENKFSIPTTEVVSKKGKEKLVKNVINYFS